MAGSNYDVNIKLDVRKINQQINNLERRISKLNALAQGKRGDSKILLKNERDKAALILKQERAQKRVNRELQKTNKLKKENLLLTNKTTAKTTADKSRASSGSTVVSTGGGKSGVLSGALISGAFPLLFGQGPLGGALGFAGGAIGGAIGGQTGGFAGGLIATAGLTQIQQAIQGINELGAALKPESLNLDKLITSLGLIGTEESKRLKLIEQLEGKQAARVMTQMMSGLTSAIMDSPLGEFLTKRSQKGKINAALPGDIETTDPVLKRLIAEQQKLLAPKNEAELNKAVNQQALGPLSLSSGGLFPQQIQNTAEQQLADESSAKSLNMQLQSIERSIEARKQVLFTSKEQELKDTNAKKTSELILRDVKAQNQFLQESITLGTFQAEIEQKIRDLKQQQKAIGKDLSADDEKAFRDQLRLQRELERVNSLYQGIADTVQSGLVDAIEGAINGTKTLGDVARSVFGAIQRQLINFAATSFLRAIPGIGGFFANGGVTKPNKSYIVGERGPELFTPGVTGRVTPNHEMGGGSTNVVVNVDASGSNVEGDEDEGRALGVALSAAIEAELLKQKRPGGLLA